MIAAERDCFAKIEYTRSALEAVTEWAQYVYRRNLKVYGMFALAVGCWDHPAAGEHNFTLNWLWHYTPLCGGNSSCSFRINKWYWDKQTNIETNEWYTLHDFAKQKFRAFRFPIFEWDMRGVHARIHSEYTASTFSSRFCVCVCILAQFKFELMSIYCSMFAKQTHAHRTCTDWNWKCNGKWNRKTQTISRYMNIHEICVCGLWVWFVLSGFVAAWATQIQYKITAFSSILVILRRVLWQMTNHRLLCLYSICFQCHKSHIMMRTDDDCDHLRTQTHTNRIINYLFINRIHPRRYQLNCSTPRSWNESHCYLTSTIHFTCVTQIKWFRSTTHPEYQQRNDTYMHLHTREFSQSPVLPLLRRTFNSFAMTFALCECV